MKQSFNKSFILSIAVHGGLAAALLMPPMETLADNPEVPVYSIKIEAGQVRTPVKKIQKKDGVVQQKKKAGEAFSLDGEIKAQSVNYEMLVASRIEKQRFYPVSARKKKIQGTGYVYLKINADGTLVDAKLVQSSGSSLLDETALDMVKSAAPFPGIPGELKMASFEARIPISFRLN